MSALSAPAPAPAAAATNPGHETQSHRCGTPRPLPPGNITQQSISVPQESAHGRPVEGDTDSDLFGDNELANGGTQAWEIPKINGLLLPRFSAEDISRILAESGSSEGIIEHPQNNNKNASTGYKLSPARVHEKNSSILKDHPLDKAPKNLKRKRITGAAETVANAVRDKKSRASKPVAKRATTKFPQKATHIPNNLGDNAQNESATLLMNEISRKKVKTPTPEEMAKAEELWRITRAKIPTVADTIRALDKYRENTNPSGQLPARESQNSFDETREFGCKFCLKRPKSFKYRTSWERHMRLCHPGKPMEYTNRRASAEQAGQPSQAQQLPPPPPSPVVIDLTNL